MPTPLETRIINIQKKIKITATGIFDLATCVEIEKLKGISLSSTSTLFEHKKEIQKSLGFVGKEIDGIVGPATISRIEDFVSKILPSIPVGATMIVSKKSLDIIINSEISSKSAYQTKYKFPIWPEGDSGITIGIGYDLGYVSLTQFTNDWKNVLSTIDFNKLSTTIGKKGDNAKDELAKLGYDKTMGARPLNRVISEKIKKPLTDEILFGKLKKGGVVKIDFKDDFVFIYE